MKSVEHLPAKGVGKPMAVRYNNRLIMVARLQVDEILPLKILHTTFDEHSVVPVVDGMTLHPHRIVGSTFTLPVVTPTPPKDRYVRY